jgi:hypothetical protein
MRVRIRVTRPVHRFASSLERTAALALATLLAPASLTAFTLACWRIAADLRWTNAFLFSTGILSRWQVWLAASAIFLFPISALNRYGRGDHQIS